MKARTWTFFEGIITTVINKAIKKVGNENDYPRIRSVVDKILNDIENMPDVEILPAEHKCILLKFRCTTYTGILNMLMYLESRSFLDSLNHLALALSSTLPNVSGQIRLDATVTPECMKDLLDGLRAKTMKTTEYKRTIRVPIKVESVQGIEHIWSLFESGGVTKKLNELSEAVFDELNTKITVTSSVNLEQVLAAITVAGEKAPEMPQAAVEDNDRSPQRHQSRSVDEGEGMLTKSVPPFERNRHAGLQDTTDVTPNILGGWSNRSVEAITAGGREIKRKIEQHGKEKINEVLKSSEVELKYTALNICVTGSSGNGKSSLINALRGIVDPDDESFAKSGTIETTRKCKGYSHPKFPNMIFWDVPGIGSQNFPRERYLKDIKFDRYEFFLICSCGRFKDDDSWLGKEIEKAFKHFYFLRTKIDIDLRNAEHDWGNNYQMDKVMSKIRKECESNLPKNLPCFLVSSYYPTKYDFPLLVQRLVDDAPSEQRHALILGLCSASKEMIEKKAEMLEAEIWKVALLSGVGGAVPIPGFSLVVDVALILETAISYREHFRLTEDEINSFAEKTGLSPDLFRKAVHLKLNPAMFTSSGIASLIATYAAETVAEESAIFIPVVGFAIAGTISYVVTGKILKTLLHNCKEDALNVFDFVARRQSSIR